MERQVNSTLSLFSNPRRWEMITVSSPKQISFDEAVIVQHVFDTLGMISAIRVVRAFAKSDLGDAIRYVRSNCAKEDLTCEKD